MLLADLVGLSLLGLTWGAQITLRSLLVRYWKFVWFGTLVIIFGIVGYWVYAQYAAWAAGPPGKYLLPPYQGWWYFYFYAGTRIAAPWLIVFLAAMALPALAEKLNRRYGERFFEPEETRFFALGIFLSGYPGFLFYIILLLLYELAFTIYLHFFKEQKRAPLYYAWLPAAAFAILIVKLLLPREIVVSFNL